jgi:hypothetical protein
MRSLKLAFLALIALPAALSLSLRCGGSGGGTTTPPAPVAPVITADPSSQTVLEGAQATFAVTATGTAPLAYQWLKTGTAIAGATSASHTTPGTLLADSGATYTVVVSNGSGLQVTSKAATLTVQALQAVPPTPAGVTALAGNAKATLTWSSSLGATSYNVYYGKTSGAARTTGTKVALAASPQDLTALTNGNAYYFAVTAVNSHGESLPSLEVSATPISTTPPSAPGGVTATGANGQVTIAWSAVGNATAYNLYWGSTPGVTKATGTAVLGVTNPYLHLGLSNGATYYYVVTAVNAYGESGASLQVSATPAAVLASAGKTQLLGSYPGLSNHYSAMVMVVGNSAYVCEKNSSWTETYLRIIDVATPAKPTLTGSYVVGGMVSAMKVLNGYLYLGLDNVLNELQTVSLANPAAPVLVAKNMNIGPYDLALFGTNMIVVGYYNADSDYISRDINIFSLVNPMVPLRIGSFYQYDASGANIWGDSSMVAVQGTMAYVAASTRGLVILNLANPAIPLYSGGYNSPVARGYSRVTVSGNYACVVNLEYGIEILNISNPAAVVMEGIYKPAGAVGDIVLDGKYLYVAEGNNGLKIIDISTPAAPVVAGYYQPAGVTLGVNGIFVAGQTIYLADTNLGLVIVRFTP